MQRIAVLLLLMIPLPLCANPPVASYIFPAGGQRGAKVPVCVGGLFLHQQCGFEMLGPGIAAPKQLKRVGTRWFEGPILPLPDSQRQEDYPKDMAGDITIAPDAALGIRYWRLWTSQGATAAMKFVVGDLPEITETEIDGDPIPVKVKLPITINGRIFPRENVDIWSFSATKGQTVRCEVHAARLGSPLDARLAVFDASGQKIAENDDYYGADPVIAFTAPADGEYQVRIQDTQNQGGQAYVYRLTLTGEPFVERVFPLGGRRGSTVEFEVAGQEVPGTMRALLPKDAEADYRHVFSVAAKRTNAVLVDVDDLPEFTVYGLASVHAKPQAVSPQAVSLPAVLNGRIDQPGKIDVWAWQGKKGDIWEFELRAASLGSRLDGVISICEAEGEKTSEVSKTSDVSAGKVLAKAESNPLDPVLRFTVPADGRYVVHVQDRFRSRGGPDFGYRLRVAAPPPADFRLWLGTDAVTLLRNKTPARLKITADRLGGFKEPITLEIRGLPEHATFTPATMNAGQASVDVSFKANDSAKIDVSRLTILGKAKIGKDQLIEHQAKVQVARGLPELSSVLFSVALPTPFVIKGVYDMGFAARGGLHRHKYKIERDGFDGPLEISLADRQARHLQGVEGPTITVPAGATEFTYTAYLPPWMETGRTSRTCVMGVGVIKEPDGSEHRVSYSSVNQNEQLVAVVGPGKLAMEAERTSYTASPGKSFTVTVRIKRGQAVEGPVTLELVTPPHLRGLSAAKATIAAKQEQGQLVVQCADSLPGPFNMPVIVRATLMRNGEPLVDEVKLEVQP